MASSNTNVTYFGKIPSRGDFVKANRNPRLLTTLDNWLEGSMELMSNDPRWKLTYDAAPPLHFAFMGSRNKLAVAGHMVTSRDQSERRFPFLTASTLSVAEPLKFVARSPLALSRLWARMQTLTNQVLTHEDCSEDLNKLAEIEVPVEVDASAYDPHFNDFLEIQSLSALQSTLQQSGHDVQIKRLLPALGLLLGPVMSSGASKLDKGLALPLPADPVHRYPVAAFWLDLIAPFLSRAEFEITVFIAAVEQNAEMILGFNGKPEQSLQSAMDPEVSAAHNIRINNPEWVDASMRSDYGLQKLASYLEQPGLSLHRARATFREVFIGS